MKKNLGRVFPALLALVLTLGLYAQQSAPSLLTGITGEAVNAQFTGTGGSSGDSVKVRVSKGPKDTPGPHTYSVPPGSMLASSEAGAQGMMILGVAGRETGSMTYTPTSSITVPSVGTAIYILKAFCAEFHKENPSESTTFTLREPDKMLACIARGGRDLSVSAFQAAVWMYTDDATFSKTNEKFDVSAEDWQKAESVFRKCQQAAQ